MNEENEQPDARDRITMAYDLVEYAWGIIANVSGSDWTLQNDVWQGAAAKWRDQYHQFLAGNYEEGDDEPDVL
jgi:hypothetical protein